ncbi:MAG: hypothetical protein V3V35_10045 [Dehalococcoidia bacterium]
MTTSAELQYITLDPSAGPLRGKDPRPMARRPASLNGAVLGLLANGKSNSQEFLDAVYDELAQAYELAPALRFKKASVSVPPRSEDFQQMVEEAAAVITAIGD